MLGELVTGKAFETTEGSERSREKGGGIERGGGVGRKREIK